MNPALPQKISQADAQRLATIFSGLIRSTTLYPPGNPALTRPLNDLHALAARHLENANSIRLGLNDGILFVEDHLFVAAAQPIEDLAKLFAGRKVDAVIVTRGVEPDELFRLAKLFANRNLAAEDIVRQLEPEQIRHIMVISNDDDADRLIHEAGQAYQSALESIRTAFNDIEEHRIPTSERLLAATRQFTDVAVQDPLVVAGLSMIKDYDNYTYNHSVNVGAIAMALAAHLKMDQVTIEEVGMAGFLHDIGKTRVSKAIINKPGKLSADEFDEIKKHPEDGVKLIEKMTGMSPKVSEAVLSHHLRYNKQGYPEWAQKLELSNLGQIVAIADCFDACTTLRVYQKPMPPAAAINRMKELAGEFLDPEMVACFAEMMGKYPPGSVVRLDTNELALIWKANSIDGDAPYIRVLFDREGKKVDQPFTEKLSDRAGGNAAIVAIVDPLLKGIDVGEYFKQA